MKLRIRGDSVRFRLTQGEVASLAAGERIEQTTRFSADSRLSSMIEPSAAVSSPLATFTDDCIKLLLPLHMICQWADSEQVGIEFDQEIDSTSKLRLLIEKDFECLHSRVEGDIDAYPNPRQMKMLSRDSA